MFDYIEQLRKKPIAYRRRFLLFSTITITAVIVLIWFSSFKVVTEISEEDSLAVEKQMKPIDEVKESIVNFIDTVKEMGQGIFGLYGVSSSSTDNK